MLAVGDGRKRLLELIVDTLVAVGAVWVCTRSRPTTRTDTRRQYWFVRKANLPTVVLAVGDGRGPLLELTAVGASLVSADVRIRPRDKFIA